MDIRIIYRDRMGWFPKLVTAVALAIAFTGTAAEDDLVNISNDPQAEAFALELAAQIRSREAPSFEPTDHPGASWFPDAAFGLFMHWGIHSVAGAQPSWAMIKDYPYGYREDLHPPEKYWALAEEFDPRDYDPDRWIAAAKEAGMTYAVLTTKHHDGYCLWPTQYGELNTGTYLGGRDLLKPYVDACRKHGLKVGFYFSPRDWSYPGFPVHFDHALRGTPHDLPPADRNQRNFDRFYAYTVGQIYELLTRYGKIDVLWWDGMGWPGIHDIYTDETLDWIRSLQPHIVLNNRWGGKGDFQTPECHLPKGAPEGWWETCTIWNGHWGYNPNRSFRPNSWVLHQLAVARSWGGNLLLNCGPGPDGRMPSGFYERCEELAGWMTQGKHALHEADSLREWPRFSPVPMTRKENEWFVHIKPDTPSPLILRHMPLPREAVLLHNGTAVPCSRDGSDLHIDVPDQADNRLGRVVVLRWDQEPDVGLTPEAADDARPGVVCELFAGKRFTKLTDFDGETPVQSQHVQTISLAPGGDREHFALRFSGYFQAPVSGEYTFHMTSDDGAALAVGGMRLIDLDGLHGPVRGSGRITLKAGLHTLEVLYFQAGGDKELTLQFEGPALPLQSIPPENLWHDG